MRLIIYPYKETRILIRIVCTYILITIFSFIFSIMYKQFLIIFFQVLILVFLLFVLHKVYTKWIIFDDTIVVRDLFKIVNKIKINNIYKVIKITLKTSNYNSKEFYMINLDTKLSEFSTAYLNRSKYFYIPAVESVTEFLRTNSVI